MATCVDIVVHTATEPDGRRRVREIVAVPGRAEGGVVEIEDLFVTRGGILTRTSGHPPHRDRFERAGIDIAAILSRADG